MLGLLELGGGGKMWLSKSKKNDDDVEVVLCHDCGVVISGNYGQKVTFTDGANFRGSGFFTYCSIHRKPYDRIVLPYFMYSHEKRYYKEMQVDEDGIPVGYRKVVIT